MATLVAFHAHPDDESIAMGGVMAKAAEEGHRVILVVATRGEHGEVAEGFLDPGEALGSRREAETLACAELLGVARVEFLDYVDSGMMGAPENDLPATFWQADVEEAAARLARVLAEEGAHVLTAYDEYGLYGHPDHIQVHRVGLRAAELAGTPRVYLSTINRDHLTRALVAAAEAGAEIPHELGLDFVATLGVSEELITTVVDVRPWLTRKRAAIATHASQIAETSFFLAMGPEMFDAVFGQECFIRCDARPGLNEADLFDGIG